MNTPILTKGTDGGENYLVVARSGDVALSLRPIAFNDDARNGKITLLVRVRASRYPGALVDLDGDAIMAGFPDMPFENMPHQNSSRPRCSVYCAIFTEQTQRLFLEKALEAQRFTSKVYSYLSQFVPADSFIVDYTVFSEQLMAHVLKENVTKNISHEIAQVNEEYAAAAILLGESHMMAVQALEVDFQASVKALTEDFLTANPDFIGDGGVEENAANPFDTIQKLIKYAEAEDSYANPNMPVPAEEDPDGYGTI